jgi:hypothetical protein
MKKMEDQFKGTSKKNTETHMCANFSGVWSGTCTYSDGNSGEARLSITQSNCRTFDISAEDSTETFEINKIERLGNTDIENMTDFQANGHTEWDIARRVLIMSVNGFYKSINTGDSGTIESKSTLEIVDGQLRTRSSQYSRSSTRPSQEIYSVECSYTK